MERGQSGDSARVAAVLVMTPAGSGAAEIHRSGSSDPVRGDGVLWPADGGHWTWDDTRSAAHIRTDPDSE